MKGARFSIDCIEECAPPACRQQPDVMTPPILYSFRRCPFAIRARMALFYAGMRVELREVNLRDIPQAMLQLSPKATVPVLHLPDGRVIDESIDVMSWSLTQADPECWNDLDTASRCLIERNDVEFKPLLDAYKYADRHPQYSELEHRQHALGFIAELDDLLTGQTWMSGSECRLADVAIFPFIRQFAGVDPAWFADCEWVSIRNWLNRLLSSELFLQVMQKYPFWKPGNERVYL